MISGRICICLTFISSPISSRSYVKTSKVTVTFTHDLAQACIYNTVCTLTIMYQVHVHVALLYKQCMQVYVVLSPLFTLAVMHISPKLWSRECVAIFTLNDMLYTLVGDAKLRLFVIRMEDFWSVAGLSRLLFMCAYYYVHVFLAWYLLIICWLEGEQNTWYALH